MGAEGFNSRIDGIFKSQLPSLPTFHNCLRYSGTMRVRHSKIEHPQDRESCDVHEIRKEWISDIETQPEDPIDEEEEKWSLVDLLSRSASATSQRQPPNPKSTPFTARNIPIPESPDEYLRKSSTRTKSQNLVNNGEDSDADVEDNGDLGDFFCGLSSASSMSWAEDAVELEQTKNLAKLWNEVEEVCAGGARPPNMSESIFTECLMWKEAFPKESVSQGHRFETIEELLLEDEDSTPTPTNEFSLVDPDSATFSETVTPYTSNTDFVTAWLSDCHLQDKTSAESQRNKITAMRTRSEGEESKAGNNNISERITSGESRRRSSILEKKPDFRTSNSEPGFNIPQLGFGSRSTTPKPSRLPIPVMNRDSTFIGKNKEAKTKQPFLLWLFDSVSNDS